MKLDTLFEKAISIKRQSESPGEMKFVAYLARRFGATMIDGAGNVHFDRRYKSGLADSGTLFVAHTDTIVWNPRGERNEWEKDAKGFYRAKQYPQPKPVVTKDKVTGKERTTYPRGGGDTLGADDGAGIALLGHLMENDVQGYYILCRGEECGGIGSRYLAKYHDDLLAEFDRAIAFDRRGYSDVITHQAGGRCASDAFGEALSDALNEQGLLYMPCDGGIFTDTANFMDIIPECTNISCGYDGEHGSKEEQDGEYLSKLGDAIVLIDWEALPTKRDPAEPEAEADDIPVILTIEDAAINEAWQAALDRSPKLLMRRVAKFLKVEVHQIDEEVFCPAEVYAAAVYAKTWHGVIEDLASQCESMQTFTLQ